MRLSRSICAFCLVAVLLSSCASGENDEKILEDIRANFGPDSHVSFAAGIDADYGDRVCSYGVSYDGGVSGGTLTITKPEVISGTTLMIADGSVALRYGEREIYTGEILPGGLSPVDAVPVILRAIAGGLVTGTVRERYEGAQCLATVFRIDDRVDARVLFEEETLLPQRAEMYLDGTRVLSLDFYDMKAE